MPTILLVTLLDDETGVDGLVLEGLDIPLAVYDDVDVDKTLLGEERLRKPGTGDD